MSGTRGFVYTTPAQRMVSDKTSISLQVNSRGISGDHVRVSGGAGSAWEGRSGQYGEGVTGRGDTTVQGGVPTEETGI